MGLEGIQYQTFVVPFVKGLSTKNDPRALEPPGLDVAADLEFDDLGALRTRKTYVDIGESIVGGGSLTNIRRPVANGTERLVFTKDTLYSWDFSQSKWRSKGTHLAVKLDESTVFASTSDQVECDRCELNGIEVVTWIEGNPMTGGSLWIAARDTANRKIVLPPTKTVASNAAWPRVVALSTKILHFYQDQSGGNVYVASIDPAAVAAPGSYTVLYASIAYDVEKIPGADQAILVAADETTPAYEIAVISAAGAVVRHANKARTMANPSPIAVACTPDGVTATVFRCTIGPAVVKADMITISNLADATVNTTVESVGFFTLMTVTAAYRSVQVGGHYQCEVFYAWNEGPAAKAAGFLRHNTINDASTVGTASNLMGLVSPVARAFDHDGRVFCWTAFGQKSGFLGDDASKLPELAVQNAAYLLRDDGHICAKAAYDVSAGQLNTNDTQAYGALPGVQTPDGTAYTFCTMERRAVALGNSSTGYAARSPRIVRATFDADEARRVVRIGRTLYVAGGEIRQYDGVQLTEVGFHVAPHYFNASAGGVGNVANGTYGDALGWRWMNATGETERSTSAVRGTSSMSGGPKQLQTGTNSGLVDASKRWYPLYLTHKTSPAVAVEVWRTQVNPTPDSPLYLVSGIDPTTTTGNNRYVVNDPTLVTLGEFDDAEDDATIGVNEQHPENDGSLENLAPPAATIIAVGIDRVFLGGVAGQPDTIWYSKQRLEGQVAAFNDDLTVSIPPVGGDMTALAIHPQTQMLIAFRETSIWELPGTGLDNTGGGSNYGPPIMLSSDVGAVNAEAVAAAPFGLFFKSDKGFYRLGGGSDLQYIGAAVAAFDAEGVLAIHVMESQHQIRVVTTGRILMYDYLVGEWASWTFPSAVGAAMWSGAHAIVTASAVKIQTSAWGIGTVDYGQDVEMAFFKPAGLMGNMIVRRIMVLGEYRSAFALRIRLARDYQQDGSGNWVYYDDDVWTVSPTTVGSALQVAIGPSQQCCESIKVRLSAINVNGNKSQSPTGEAVKFTAIAFEVGFEEGMFSQLPVAQMT